MKILKLEYLSILLELGGLHAGLKDILLSNNHKLRSIQALETCSNLATCRIEDCMSLDNLSVLESLTSLKEVRISGCHSVELSSLSVGLTQREGLDFHLQTYTIDDLNVPENFIFEEEDDEEEEDDDDDSSLVVEN